MDHPAPWFADRIVNVALTGPLVRLELGVLSPPASQGQSPTIHASRVLVMPLDGFVASYGLLDTLIKKLVADGLLKPNATSTGSDLPVATDANDASTEA